jgi:hypothetical protein
MLATAMLAAHLLSIDLLPFCHKRHDDVHRNVAVAEYLEGSQKEVCDCEGWQNCLTTL